MSQIHNKNSFYARGVCKSTNHLNLLLVILNNDQKEVFVNQKRGVINLYYKSSGTITRWQYNNLSNTVNAQAAGGKPAHLDFLCGLKVAPLASPREDPGRLFPPAKRDFVFATPSGSRRGAVRSLPALTVAKADRARASRPNQTRRSNRRRAQLEGAICCALGTVASQLNATTVEYFPTGHLVTWCSAMEWRLQTSTPPFWNANCDAKGFRIPWRWFGHVDNQHTEEV